MTGAGASSIPCTHCRMCVVDPRSELHFKPRRDYPAVGISGQTAADTERRFNIGRDLGLSGCKHLVTLVTRRVEPGNRTKNRVVLQTQRAFVTQCILESSARLEFPLMLPAAEPALERGIQQHGDVSKRFPQNGRDLVRPAVLGEARPRVSDFLRNACMERQIPAAWSDGGEARPISDVLESRAIPRVGNR